MAFAAIIVLANLPLVMGGSPAPLVFLPDRIMHGEWWRVFTHPFVHVSLYHLALDAAAFLMLYSGLHESNWLRRVGYVIACAIGSLLASSLAWPQFADSGLCGLSALAHGLMAVLALEMMSGHKPGHRLRRIGAFCLATVLAKSVIEAITGEAFLRILHFGALGSPVAVCHAGGVLGGVLGYVFLKAGAKHAFVVETSNLKSQTPQPCMVHKLIRSEFRRPGTATIT